MSRTTHRPVDLDATPALTREPETPVTAADVSAAGLDSRAHEWLTANADNIVELVPEPGRPWVVAETELAGHRHTAFLMQAIVKKFIIPVVTEEYPNPKNKVFVTHPHAYRFAEQVHEAAPNRLPCGHRGISNVSMDPPTYACLCEACEKTFDRVTVEAVMASD